MTEIVECLCGPPEVLPMVRLTDKTKVPNYLEYIFEPQRTLA